MWTGDQHTGEKPHKCDTCGLVISIGERHHINVTRRHREEKAHKYDVDWYYIKSEYGERNHICNVILFSTCL